MWMSRTPALCLALLALAGCPGRKPASAGGGDAGAHGVLTVKGSDTMVLLGQRWAEDFMKQSPDVRVQVTGGGSGVGLASLLNGTTDVAMSSRRIKDAEARRLAQGGTAHVELPVARDGVTFFVHPSNPLTSLTVGQLRDIYLGDVTDWSQVGGPARRIVLYSRENSSGTYTFVKDELLGGLDFASEAMTLPGTAAVVNAVSQEAWGIGYGGAAYGTRVKVLAVAGEDGQPVAPTVENVASGRYPLSRDLFFYLRGPPTGAARAYVDFTLSPEGQAVVTRVGYFPLQGGAGDAGPSR
jgi:phosphate transport system substrate-binding protein